MPFKICWIATFPGGLDISVVNIEKAERKFVESFLKPGMTVLDIGAHHGLYTTLMSKLVGSSGTVFAFEPSPMEREGLMRHLRLNSCRNVTVSPCAVSSSTGTAEFFLVKGHRSGASSLRHPMLDGRIEAEKIRVRVTTIDQYLGDQGIRHVDFVKMDIEGAELDAFVGAERLLRGENRPTLMVEMSDPVTEAWGYPTNKKYDLLRSWGYDWFEFSADGVLSLSPRRERYEGFGNLVAKPGPRRGPRPA
jgi:FkbM family methyltransferase